MRADTHWTHTHALSYTAHAPARLIHSFKFETLQPFLLRLAAALSASPEPLHMMNSREATMTLWAYASAFPRPRHLSSPSARLSPPVLYDSSAPREYDPEPVHDLFTAAASSLSASNCTMRDLSTLAWSFATTSHPATCPSSLAFLAGAAEALEEATSNPHPRDLATLCWSLSHLSARSRRLTPPLLGCLAVSSSLISDGSLPLGLVHTSDLVQLAAAYGVGRVDDGRALREVYEVASGRMREVREEPEAPPPDER